MPGEFPCDVLLSHSAKDKPVVRDVAERLKKDGLRVWFDEWEIRLGDSVERTQSKTAKIEEGLKRSSESSNHETRAPTHHCLAEFRNCRRQQTARA